MQDATVIAFRKSAQHFECLEVAHHSSEDSVIIPSQTTLAEQLGPYPHANEGAREEHEDDGYCNDLAL